MRKTKRYADGGTTLVVGGQSPTNMDPSLTTSGGLGTTYPFSGSSTGGAGSSNTTNTNVSVGAQPTALEEAPMFKRGGAVKGRRGDGICQRGHTKGRMV